MGEDQDISIPFASPAEKAAQAELAALLEASPIPKDELCDNLALYIRRQSLMDLLGLQELYKRILTVPGIIIEVGTRWGRNLATLMSLRGIYEPYNIHRRIVGFDTFAGFVKSGSQDGTAAVIRSGAFATVPGYKEYLERLLGVHERMSPIGHLRRFEVHQGDVVETVPRYLKAHPESVVALVYFDLDLYQPTRAVLETLAPRLVRGSILAFDEVGHPEFPGETRALIDSIGLQRYDVELIPGHPRPTLFTVK
jgi:hypothetical protein